MFKQVFAHFTSVIETKVVRDRRTDKPKGFGFVSFGDAIDRDLALATMDMVIYTGEKPLKLSMSKTKGEATLDSAEESIEAMLQLLEHRLAKENDGGSSVGATLLTYNGTAQGPFEADLGPSAITSLRALHKSKRSLLCDGLCVCAFAAEALRPEKNEILKAEEQVRFNYLLHYVFPFLVFIGSDATFSL
jgi:hypothetical protein